MTFWISFESSGRGIVNYHWLWCKSLLVLLSGERQWCELTRFCFLFVFSAMTWRAPPLHPACLYKWQPESGFFFLKKKSHQSCRTEERVAVAYRCDFTLSLLWMEEKEPLSKACTPNGGHPWDCHEWYLTGLFVGRFQGYGLAPMYSSTWRKFFSNEIQKSHKCHHGSQGPNIAQCVVFQSLFCNRTLLIGITA